MLFSVETSIYARPRANFNISYDILLQNLVTSQSHNKGSLNCDNALKFDKCLGSTDAETPVKISEQ